jgi:hypothetical protein
MPDRGLTEMALLCQLGSGGVGQLPAGCHTALMHWFTRGLLTGFLVGPLLCGPPGRNSSDGCGSSSSVVGLGRVCDFRRFVGWFCDMVQK